MTTEDLYDRWCRADGPFRFTPERLEQMRRALSGTFVARTKHGILLAPNVVTNEGINHLLVSALTNGTRITTWRLALVKTNTPAAVTMSYSTPVYTEIAPSDVSESVRAVWSPGAVASQAVNNDLSPGQYTAAVGFSAYALGLVGGGSSPQTIADSAGGGVLYSYGLFSGGVRVLAPTDVINCTYQLGGADDGA